MILRTSSSSKIKGVNKYYKKRPLWTMKNDGGFTMHERHRRGNDPTMLFSIPVYNKFINTVSNTNDTSWERIIIKLKDESNSE